MSKTRRLPTRGPGGRFIGPAAAPEPQAADVLLQRIVHLLEVIAYQTSVQPKPLDGYLRDLYERNPYSTLH